MAIVMFSHAFLLQPPAVAALCSTALLQIKLLFGPNRSGCSFADGPVLQSNQEMELGTRDKPKLLAVSYY